MTDTAANRRPSGNRPLRLREEGLVDATGKCTGYTVCDPRGRKIGSVAALFFNDYDEPEYIEVKMGLFFGLKTVLIPVTNVVVNEKQRTLVLQ